MKLEILLSCMFQNDVSIVERLNLQSDILIINQCEKDEYFETYYNGFKVRMISTKTRGLSKSRNIALENAVGDVLLLMDDDCELCDDYPSLIIDEYTNNGNADCIFFNYINIDDCGGTRGNKKYTKRRKYSYGYPCSIRISFKRTILEKNIRFNEMFGAGSGIYDSGEEALFVEKIKKYKFGIYEVPVDIMKVSFKESSWFKGYDEKYFFDKGALCAALFPKSIKVLKFILFFKFAYRKTSNLIVMYKSFNKGIGDYMNNLWRQ